MRNHDEMKRIDKLMQRIGVIQIRCHTRGRNYYLDDELLNGQIVRDMINDGWLIEGDSIIYRA